MQSNSRRSRMARINDPSTSRVIGGSGRSHCAAWTETHDAPFENATARHSIDPDDVDMSTPVDMSTRSSQHALPYCCFPDQSRSFICNL